MANRNQKAELKNLMELCQLREQERDIEIRLKIESNIESNIKSHQYNTQRVSYDQSDMRLNNDIVIFKRQPGLIQESLQDPLSKPPFKTHPKN